MLGMNMISAMIPVIKPHLPKVEAAIHESLIKVELDSENGEKYAGFVIVNSIPTGAKILLVAFDGSDRVVRTISKSSVVDFLQSLIEKAK